MPTSNDIDLYKQANGAMEAEKATASQLIGGAAQSLQQTLQGWEVDPVCPSGNYGVPPDVLAITLNRQRVFSPKTREEREIAKALARYYAAAASVQRKWALLSPNQKQGLPVPDPLAFA
jgi:hypothetical protein